jgi:hypothetical protein
LKPRPFKSRGCSSLAVPIPQQLLEVPSDLDSVQEVEVPSLEIEDPLVSAVKIVSPSYLGCNSSDIPANDKDGVSNGEEVADPCLEFTDAIEEDLLRIVKFGRCKNKAMRELRNLNSSINYGKSNVSSRQGKGNGHVM